MARLADPALPLTKGDGTIRALPGILAGFGIRRPLVVTGASSWANTGAGEFLQRALPDFARLPLVAPGPSLQDVAAGIAELNRTAADGVVGLGGGSALDLAKMVALMARQPEAPAAYLCRGEYLPPYRELPLILIPTTAGSGSEMTRLATVKVHERTLCLSHVGLRADHVVVDPTLAAGAPLTVTAATGVNVLAQAVESYLAVNSAPESREHALQALDLALFHLEMVCHNPTMAARRAMCEAATLVGRATDISRTSASHVASQSIAADCGVPHGHVRGLILPKFLRFNAGVRADDCADPRGVAFVRTRIDELLGCLGAASVDAGARSLRNLIAAAGLPMRLSNVRIAPETITRAVETTLLPALVANNPRRLAPDALSGILAAIR